MTCFFYGGSKSTVCGPKLTCFKCDDRLTCSLCGWWRSNLTRFSDASRKSLGFSVSIEIDLVLSVRIEIYLVFVCGPKNDLFFVWGSIDLVFVRVVEIDWFL